MGARRTVDAGPNVGELAAPLESNALTANAIEVVPAGIVYV